MSKFESTARKIDQTPAAKKRRATTGNVRPVTIPKPPRDSGVYETVDESELIYDDEEKPATQRLEGKTHLAEERQALREEDETSRTQFIGESHLSFKQQELEELETLQEQDERELKELQKKADYLDGLSTMNKAWNVLKSLTGQDKDEEKIEHVQAQIDGLLNKISNNNDYIKRLRKQIQRSKQPVATYFPEETRAHIPQRGENFGEAKLKDLRNHFYNGIDQNFGTFRNKEVMKEANEIVPESAALYDALQPQIEKHGFAHRPNEDKVVAMRLILGYAILRKARDMNEQKYTNVISQEIKATADDYGISETELDDLFKQTLVAYHQEHQDLENQPKNMIKPPVRAETQRRPENPSRQYKGM